LFHILIDTCVWLEMGKDYTQKPLLEGLEVLIKDKQISLILPRTIIDEFANNKARVLKESNQSLSGAFKRVKEAVKKYGDTKQKKAVLQYLNDIDHKLPRLSDTATEAFTRMEAIFAKSKVIEPTDAVKLRCAQRAIDKKAPFHREGKNGIHDAILIETYADFTRDNNKADNRFAFVTHNIKDFSQNGEDNQLPHSDIAVLFSKIKSLYFISLAAALRRIEPALISELMFVQESVEEPRRLTEISEAIEEFVTKVWYNRHQIRREKIEAGITKIVERETFPVKDHEKRPIQRDVWEGALRAAAKVEKSIGLENLGPWDDFEWGMLNGKLSALRWVLGDEWDMLDT
jgi:hypothetical protein